LFINNVLLFVAELYWDEDYVLSFSSSMSSAILSNHINNHDDDKQYTKSSLKPCNDHHLHYHYVALKANKSTNTFQTDYSANINNNDNNNNNNKKTIHKHHTNFLLKQKKENCNNFLLNKNKSGNNFSNGKKNYPRLFNINTIMIIMIIIIIDSN
jgi:hypothetical protein